MIPISWIRSKTDIAIVFVTPIPPTISASSEKIQPAVTIRRLDVSTLHRLARLGRPRRRRGSAASSALRDVLRRRPGSTVTRSVVTSAAGCASYWTTGSGSTAPMSRSGCPSGRGRRSGSACFSTWSRSPGPSWSAFAASSPSIASRPRPGGPDDHEPAVGELVGPKPKTRNASRFWTWLTRRKIGAASATPGSDFTFSTGLGEERAGQVGGALLEDPEVGAADMDQLVGRLLARPRRSRAARRSVHADRHASHRQRRARLPPQQVLQHEPTPGHEAIVPGVPRLPRMRLSSAA